MVNKARTESETYGGMVDARYEVEKPQIRSALNAIAKRIGGALDEGWGFLLMLFQYGEDGSLFYISSADRQDCMRMAQEWIDRQSKSKPLHEQSAGAVWPTLGALLLLRLAGDDLEAAKAQRVTFLKSDYDRLRGSSALTGGTLNVAMKVDDTTITLQLTSATSEEELNVPNS